MRLDRISSFFLKHFIFFSVVFILVILGLLLIHFLNTGYQDNIVLGKDYIDPLSLQEAEYQSTPECQEKQKTAQNLIAPIQAREEALGNFITSEHLPMPESVFDVQHKQYTDYQSQITSIEIQYSCQNGS